MGIKIGLVEGGIEPSNHDDPFYDYIKEKSEVELLQPIASALKGIHKGVDGVSEVVSPELPPPPPDWL